MMNIDPRISWIDKILSKICPKFLDLRASIYGTFSLRCDIDFNLKNVLFKSEVLIHIDYS